MKTCPSCNILFNTKDKLCPLCQNTLIGEASENNFPTNTWFKTNSLILKITLFLSITIILITAFIENLLSTHFIFTFYTSLGLLTNYVIVYCILKSERNIFKLIGGYGLIIIALLIIWYLAIKSPIITNYIIPSVCLIELLFNLIVAIILRNNFIIKYRTQILLNVAYLFIPLLLVHLNLTTNDILSYICSLVSIIVIIGLIIFCFDDIKEELSKIFNI